MMRSCLSSQKVRRDVVDSHRAVRPDQIKAATFGGQPHPLPKPQPCGPPVPLPPAHQSYDSRISTFALHQCDDDPFFQVCNRWRSTSAAGAAPPPPSPSSSGKCSPGMVSKTSLVQEYPSPAHTRSSTSTIEPPPPPPPPCSSSSSSSSPHSSSSPWCSPAMEPLPLKKPFETPALVANFSLATSPPPSLATIPSLRVPPPQEPLPCAAYPRNRSSGPANPSTPPPLPQPSFSSSSSSSWGKQQQQQQLHSEPCKGPETEALQQQQHADRRLDVRQFRLHEIERECSDDFSPESGAAAEQVRVSTAKVGVHHDGAPKNEPRYSLQGSRDWASKVSLIAGLSDHHVCKLKGYYECGSEEDGSGPSSSSPRLVYEHIGHGNLSDYLFRSLCKALLDWRTRTKIALGAARGLAYIHDIAPVEVVYRDFRSSNVLLDADFSVKLAGVGLDVITPDENKLDKASSKVLKESEAIARRNIQSFGVSVLELLKGKHSEGEEFSKNERCFIQWAKPYLRDHDKLVTIIDPQLRGQYPCTAARKLAALALQCLRKDPRRRPNISEVIESLETAITLLPANKKEVFFRNLRKCRSLKRVHQVPTASLSRTVSNKL